MSGSLVSNYSQIDSNILEMQLTLDQTRKSLHAVSLTNYNNTSLPAIAAGSVIEVNGALYKFTSEEAITGSPSDGTVYVYIDPATITAVFTNTSPTWSDSKQGWYGTTTTANCRYLEFKMTKLSAAYNNKVNYSNYVIGHVTPVSKYGGSVQADILTNNLYAAMSAFIPIVGDKMCLSGHIVTPEVSPYYIIVSLAERTSSTAITLYGTSQGSGAVLSTRVISTTATGTTYRTSVSW